MPIESFLAFLSWPIIYLVVAAILYFVMAKQDARIDDSEFEQGMNRGRKDVNAS